MNRPHGKGKVNSKNSSSTNEWFSCGGARTHTQMMLLRSHRRTPTIDKREERDRKLTHTTQQQKSRHQKIDNNRRHTHRYQPDNAHTNDAAATTATTTITVQSKWVRQTETKPRRNDGNVLMPTDCVFVLNDRIECNNKWKQMMTPTTTKCNQNEFSLVKMIFFLMKMNRIKWKWYEKWIDDQMKEKKVTFCLLMKSIEWNRFYIRTSIV